jgi:hypothetical protein
MTKRRRFAAAVAVLVAAAVLAGCAGIPDSGPVRAGGRISQVTEPLDLDFNPSPPAKDASQLDLLHGFIDAASSPRNSYSIAREFLTPRLAATWDPDASVTVDQGTGRVYQETSTISWTLAVTPQAVVDSSGDYHQVTSKSPVTLAYSFQKIAGQWRISVAPDGIVLDASTFNSVFSPQDLYFYSPDYQYLVPDQRWFPARASTATRIVKALLTGPSPWLQGAVISAFPKGTQLRVGAVTTTGDQAQVDLTSDAAQAGALTLERMQLQLSQSLGTLVSSVQISIEGTTQSIRALSAANMPSTTQTIDSHPLVSRGGNVGFLTGSTLSAIPGISDKLDPLHPTSVVLSSNRQTAAALTASGVFVARASTTDAPTKADGRPGLIAPSLDNYGYAWTVPADDPSSLTVMGVDGTSRPVKTNWPSATQIASLAVSRDGTRLIAILMSGDEWTVVAAGITRDSSNVPISVGQPFVLSMGSGTPISTAWIDNLEIVTLSAEPNGQTSVAQQQIGGTLNTSVGPLDGAEIAGAGGVAEYLVRTSAGSLQAPTGAGWQVQADKIDVLGTQMGTP